MNVPSAPIALSTCFSTFAQTAAVGSLRGRSAPRQNGDPGFPSRNGLRRPNACPCLTAVRILLHTPSEFARSHRRGDDAIMSAIGTGRRSRPWPSSAARWGAPGPTCVAPTIGCAGSQDTVKHGLVLSTVGRRTPLGREILTGQTNCMRRWAISARLLAIAEG
jgi:hypothetical protein